jgi:hypothetical protein
MDANKKFIFTQNLQEGITIIVCTRCDNKAVLGGIKVWIGVGVTLLIFILSQVFMYGEVIGTINQHIKNDPSFEQLTEKFVTKDEFKSFSKMLEYIYKKNGGKE